jgi:hypothetical protein
MSNEMRKKMDTQKIIQYQYLAALTIFEKVIVKCPVAAWNAPGEKTNYRTYKKIDLDWEGIQPT